MRPQPLRSQPLRAGSTGLLCGETAGSTSMTSPQQYA
eukprot:CAMPEP_0173272222 /NCGR_PEP_ID=MMETSP1143-20121109/1242_1 /TAXON_ID=483371 /ORGANISM="non described non described, Strain CCMP2298" /LENGTH=36 /DNA_ID= /DNA_START= /DNA_END= /DNA_ORIENTATION=